MSLEKYLGVVNKPTREIVEEFSTLYIEELNPLCWPSNPVTHYGIKFFEGLLEPGNIVSYEHSSGLKLYFTEDENGNSLRPAKFEVAYSAVEEADVATEKIKRIFSDRYEKCNYYYNNEKGRIPVDELDKIFLCNHSGIETTTHELILYITQEDGFQVNNMEKFVESRDSSHYLDMSVKTASNLKTKRLRNISLTLKYGEKNITDKFEIGDLSIMGTTAYGKLGSQNNGTYRPSKPVLTIDPEECETFLDSCQLNSSELLPLVTHQWHDAIHYA